LRGYGNAIVPPVAAAFIRAYLEVTFPMPRKNAVIERVITSLDAKIEALLYANQQLLAQQAQERKPAAVKVAPTTKRA
jgi:hypothetical protein